MGGAAKDAQVAGVKDAEVYGVKARLVAGVKDVQGHVTVVEERYRPQHFLVDRILCLRRRHAMFSLRNVHHGRSLAP